MHFVVSYIIFYIFIFTEELVDLKKCVTVLFVVCTTIYFRSYCCLTGFLFGGGVVVFQTEPYPHERTLWDDLTWTNALPVS